MEKLLGFLKNLFSSKQLEQIVTDVKKVEQIVEVVNSNVEVKEKPKKVAKKVKKPEPVKKSTKVKTETPTKKIKKTK